MQSNTQLRNLSPVVGRDFYDRARERLTLDVPPALHDHSITDVIRGDLDLDPKAWELAGVQATRPAAVLVGVVDHPEPSVLLTMRTSDLPSHAGQIAFPGGKMDPTDASPLAAAVREADEEIGLDAAVIEPIGYLDLYLTFSGFRILPLVARVIPNFELRINAREVVDAFEVPLSFLMSPDNHKRGARDWKGIRREYYEMPFGDRYIWGVTAGILRNLYEKLYER
jgi:8-oxo-dGTP pyrophosphatase MutT (NUDIX family)